MEKASVFGTLLEQESTFYVCPLDIGKTGKAWEEGAGSKRKRRSGALELPLPILP